MKVLLHVIILLALVSAHGQEGVADIEPVHAAALQDYLQKNRNRIFLSEKAMGEEDLRLLRQTFGKRFRPYYAVGDFNADRMQDFAVLLSRKEGTPGPDDKSMTLVVFNRNSRGAFRVAHVEDLEAPLSCFIRLADDPKKRLYFAVSESDADTFSLVPAGRGYIVESHAK